MTELSFGGTAITAVPAWVAECTSLEVLYLYCTKIVEPPDVSTLTDLSYLDLEGCDQLRALPDVSAINKNLYLSKPDHLK